MDIFNQGKIPTTTNKMMKPAPVSFLILAMLALCLLLAACGGAAPPEPTPAPTVDLVEALEPEATEPPEEEGLGSAIAKESEEIVVARTPEPTPTPDRVAQQISQVTTAAGLARTYFLGLRSDDWFNLGISLLYVLFAYLIGSLVVRIVLYGVGRRSSHQLGDGLKKAIDPYLRWLVVILVLGFATNRLTFLDADLKAFLTDVYFVLGVILATVMVWRLIDLAHSWYREELSQAEGADQLDPVLLLLTRMGRIVLLVVSVSILLSNFGINVTALIAALGLGGLALSLAAQDTLSDAIAGFIILADRPYRVGDRIEIENLGTWGDVVDIGLRTTRIRTRDNRMVIVPNSLIGRNQVINYTFPDPRYRVETHVSVTYGTNLEDTRRLIVETVRQVEGVLTDKPVEALYDEMGESAMIFRVRWWIESYTDTRHVYDQVNTALQRAMDGANIKATYPTQRLLLQLDPDAAEQFSQYLPKK